MATFIDFDCGAVALSASVFPFDVLDGRCKVIVSIPDHCFSFYLFDFTAASTDCCIRP